MLSHSNKAHNILFCTRNIDAIFDLSMPVPNRLLSTVNRQFPSWIKSLSMKMNKSSNPSYPCLWFDGKAQDAADFYCTVFASSKISSANAMVVMFELEGRRFMALNGGPKFKINPSISFFVTNLDDGVQSMAGVRINLVLIGN
jgi:hypothetical protein